MMKNDFKAKLIAKIICGKLSELGYDTRIEDYADYVLVGALNPNKRGFGVVLWKKCEGEIECRFAKMFVFEDDIGFNWNYNKELVYIGEDNIDVSIDKIVREICISVH